MSNFWVKEVSTYQIKKDMNTFNTGEFVIVVIYNMVHICGLL